MQKLIKIANRPQLTLFFTGLIQVYFVAVNVYLLSKEIYLGVFITGFLISYIWSFNVKRVAFGSNIDRIAYALGAAFGSLLGLYCGSFFAAILN